MNPMALCSELLWTTPWVFVTITTLLKFVVLIVGFVLPLSSVLTWMERKQSALSQDRMGPHRAHFMRLFGRPVTLFGLVHVIADATKMLFKEPFRPAMADTFVFMLAPAIGFVSTLLVMAFVPFGPDLHLNLPVPFDVVPLQLVRIDGGLLWIFAAGSLGIYGSALAGFSSNNKFALLGGLRASAQSISYEIALGLTLVGMLMVCGTSELSGMLKVQHGPLLWGVIPPWGIFLQPLGAILFLVAAMAETKRAPFDMPEGESEIIGYFLEYSSMGFGLFMLGEFAEVVALAAVFTTLFLGGWQLPWAQADGSVSLGFTTLEPQSVSFCLLGMLVFAGKTFLMCALQLQVRWTLPRFRYDQLMNIGWKGLLPLSLVNIVLSAGLIAYDPTLDILLKVGVLQIAAFFAVCLIGPATPTQNTELAPAVAGGSHGH